MKMEEESVKETSHCKYKCGLESQIQIQMYNYGFGLCNKDWDKWCEKTDKQKDKQAQTWFGKKCKREE
jgi:hypothetical protein